MAYTRWTPELIEQVRKLAEEGRSSGEVCNLLKVKTGILYLYSQKHGITFQVRPKKTKAAPMALAVPAEVSADHPERALQTARNILAHEIALAKAEAATAPLYRGGWP